MSWTVTICAVWLATSVAVVQYVDAQVRRVRDTLPDFHGCRCSVCRSIAEGLAYDELVSQLSADPSWPDPVVPTESLARPADPEAARFHLPIGRRR